MSIEAGDTNLTRVTHGCMPVFTDPSGLFTPPYTDLQPLPPARPDSRVQRLPPVSQPSNPKQLPDMSFREIIEEIGRRHRENRRLSDEIAARRGREMEQQIKAIRDEIERITQALGKDKPYRVKVGVKFDWPVDPMTDSWPEIVEFRDTTIGIDIHGGDGAYPIGRLPWEDDDVLRISPKDATGRILDAITPPVNVPFPLDRMTEEAMRRVQKETLDRIEFPR